MRRIKVWRLEQGFPVRLGNLSLEAADCCFCSGIGAAYIFAVMSGGPRNFGCFPPLSWVLPSWYHNTSRCIYMI